MDSRGLPTLKHLGGQDSAEVFVLAQNLLERTHKKDVLFTIEDWKAKVGSQETPRVTGKFGLSTE